MRYKPLGPIVPLYCSALSLARSAQAERDNESCLFVRAAGVHQLIRRYHVKSSRETFSNEERNHATIGRMIWLLTHYNLT
ncbi:hypothetical protein EVAR_19166_1 [Eumeta japonica]|uniref:Uncharacterized protein n=1 Tax=Eumeta variegata TaxID=151549 RepID=A0A4C1VLQ5_EUMVA|nr:hypothetical protein EVAR_19166_1 [Eumeta japonica]